MDNLDPDIYQAVVCLGGKGTRLSAITKSIPKPLWPIEGIHTLERCIEKLSDQGIHKYIWLAGYKNNLFIDEAKRIEQKYNVSIFIHIEENPKGEAGSLLDLVEKLDEKFIFVNGDIIFDIDLRRFIEFDFSNQADVTFITHLTSHPEDSDCIVENKELSIARYKLKDQILVDQGFYLGNAGIALLSKSLVNFVKKSNLKFTKKLSLFRDFIIFGNDNNFRVISYNTSEYLKDMGTPKRLQVVTRDIRKNIPNTNSYKSRQRAIFLDRDNTIIKCKYGEYITDANSISYYEERIKNISLLTQKYQLALIISNQPQIAMGKVSWQDVIDINGQVIIKCQSLGLNIAGFYICPHHPHSGYRNEINELKYRCFCRKPSPGLLLEASINRNIDLTESILIGDSWRDQKAAISVGMNFEFAKEFDSINNLKY